MPWVTALKPPAKTSKNTSNNSTNPESTNSTDPGRARSTGTSRVFSVPVDRLSDYQYDLPEELIARYPPEERDAARMMVLRRGEKSITHARFRDLPSFLAPGDVAVLNNSRVLRARLPCGPENRDEVLLAEPVGDLRWLCLVRPGRRWKLHSSHAVAGTTAKVLQVLPGGERILEFDAPPYLERFGVIPLPPYLKRKAEKQDDIRYQTVFAEPGGSVAAPTAGLHFTPEMLTRIPHCFLTLHVGPGTFAPIKTDIISEHRMHEERYELPVEAVRRLAGAKRVLAVGTTVARVLESQPPGPLRACHGRTDLMIRPPFNFRHFDLLLTNFHLPGSTLLLLVSALAGREFILGAYAEAVRERYRFFSYGDCMLVLP
jgi:S-adenosylmethionine:tRNA ribosyltransferase-isomerase